VWFLAIKGTLYLKLLIKPAVRHEESLQARRQRELRQKNTLIFIKIALTSTPKSLRERLEHKEQ
jgi:hypothetical protein